MFKLLAIVLGSMGTLTIVAVRQMDQPTPITREMESLHGSVADVSVPSMTTWFSQHQTFADKIAQECGFSPYKTKNIRWSDTTEGHICRAAVPVAALGITTNWQHN